MKNKIQYWFFWCHIACSTRISIKRLGTSSPYYYPLKHQPPHISHRDPHKQILKPFGILDRVKTPSQINRIFGALKCYSENDRDSLDRFSLGNIIANMSTLIQAITTPPRSRQVTSASKQGLMRDEPHKSLRNPWCVRIGFGWKMVHQQHQQHHHHQ